MKKLILLITLFSVLIPRQLMLKKDDMLSDRKANQPSQKINIDRQNNTINNNSSRQDITLFEWDFEGNLWNNDVGWELTETSYNSETHSYLSPNIPATFSNRWDLTSDVISLPQLGDEEIMRFKFWLWGDTPDTDGNNDSYLDDYYQLSIMDLESLVWHASENAPGSGDGSAYWCADEEIGPNGGFLDDWIQYLDTPPIVIGDNALVSADLKWSMEPYAGAAVAGTCTDGWDAANVRISNDGGATWELLEDPNLPYHFDCGYAFIYPDSEYDTGGSLNHLAAGWGGESAGLQSFSADLSAWAGQEVIIRFVFASDVAYNTFDQPDMIGFVVDNIVVEDSSGVLYGDDCDDSSDANTMVPSGEVWESIFYDYCDSTRPGGNGWEEYVPGLAFNGNALHDISDLAGKDVIVKFTSRYDDNHDGGAGQGIFIDDFIIYKEFNAYDAPLGLIGESGDTEVHLTWQDMNASGENEDFAFDNDGFGGQLISMVAADAVGYAGTSFNFAGTSTVHTVDFFHTSGQTDFRMSICPYGSSGNIFNTFPTYDCVDVETSTLTDGWNTIDVPEWQMSGDFIIAHSFNSTYAAALDETADGSHSYFSYQQSNGNTANWQSELSSDGSFEGEWGIRANVSYQGADVTYNVYRDGVTTATGINTYVYTDTGLINNTEYTYNVSATYSDGGESDWSDAVVVTPQAYTVHEESYDDGTSESTWHPASSNNWAAVKYSAAVTGEEVMRFKWYQVGSGGAMYVKIFADDNGIPGDELYSGVTTGGVDGWNYKDISSEDLIVFGDFWVGVKTFATTLPMGVDTTTDEGASMTNDGGGWSAYTGNIMFRIILDNNAASIPDSQQYAVFDVCYGAEENGIYDGYLSLADYNGHLNESNDFYITLLSMNASWDGSGYGQIADVASLMDYYENNPAVKIIINLDDIGQPYSCTQWGNTYFNYTEQVPLIIDDGPGMTLFSWFSDGNYIPSYIIVDHNMTITNEWYGGINAGNPITLIDGLLDDCGDLCIHGDLGDLNNDGQINIYDIIIMINYILDYTYEQSGDLNEDGILNIADCILLINTILDSQP